MLLHQLKWQRREQPVLSAMTTAESWNSVSVYNPTVIRVGDRYLMWYVGNSTATRAGDTKIGIAESYDGIHFTPHSGNPILTERDLPGGSAWQTPHVMYDDDEGRFRMWFIMYRNGRDPDTGKRKPSHMNALGYASSPDGLKWDVHPEVLYSGGRQPRVFKDGPESYRMWMGAAPDQQGRGIGDALFRFTSSDGLSWSRDPDPAILVDVDDRISSVVYPFVVQEVDGYTMWYGCHSEPANLDGGVFELFASTSKDGLIWTHHLDKPAFPATRNPDDFDGRYTSTPCVLDDGDRYLLYYSARDWGNLYRAGDGTIQHDGWGIYRHIGVAVCEKP